LAQAFLKKEARVQTRKPPEEGAAGRTAYEYYLWMLLMRRRAFEVADERFKWNMAEPLMRPSARSCARS
jgi:hypothetical protein